MTRQIRETIRICQIYIGIFFKGLRQLKGAETFRGFKRRCQESRRQLVPEPAHPFVVLTLWDKKLFASGSSAVFWPWVNLHYTSVLKTVILFLWAFKKKFCVQTTTLSKQSPFTWTCVNIKRRWVVGAVTLYRNRTCRRPCSLWPAYITRILPQRGLWFVISCAHACRLNM